jgi:hypothetical protein
MIPQLILNLRNEIQWNLRAKWLGQIPLRRGLPPLGAPIAIARERAFYNKVLGKALPQGAPFPPDLLVDIGCRNWSYAQALADFFPKTQLLGVEVDGWRRYWNLYRRIDLARAYAEDLCQQGHSAGVIGEDFRNVDLRSHLGSQSSNLHRIAFCFFFPFVSENPCLQWGLPKRFMDFSQLLEHSQSQIKSFSNDQRVESFWISAHQGEWEAEEARNAYQKVGFKVKESCLPVEEYRELWPSHFETHIFVAIS